MRIKRRTNALLGLVLLAAALVVLLNMLHLIPAPVFDLFLRSWPVLFVLVGLTVLLRPRVALGGLIALVISAVLVAGVATFAFSSRADQQRDDYTEPITQEISDNVTLLRIRVQTLATEVELLRRVGAERTISGQFVGSSESDIQIVYNEADASADFQLVEQQVNQLPLLENVGRGTLRLELPVDLPVDIELQAGSGAVTLNMGGIAIERLNLNLQSGDALVTLPVYQPLLSQPGDMLGTLAVRDGDITVIVDPAVAARLELNRGGSGIEPLYDAAFYNYLVGDVLEARNIETAGIVFAYTITAPRGQITVRQSPQDE